MTTKTTTATNPLHVKRIIYHLGCSGGNWESQSFLKMRSGMKCFHKIEINEHEARINTMESGERRDKASHTRVAITSMK